MARLFLAICLVLSTLSAPADGKFYGTSSMTIDIPQQRAVIMHRNGLQTMAIESQARGAGKMSWVVPVPSQETEVFEVYSSHRMAQLFRGSLYEDTLPGGWEVPAIVAVFAVLFLAGCYGTAKSHQGAGLLAVVALAILGVILAPVFAQSKGGGVTLLKSFRTDSFDADLVKGDDAATLRAWLRRNETPLSPDDEPVIADYIRRGWCFVAVHFTKPTPEASAPPALGLEFPAESMIYPMRLTAQGIKELSLELLIWTKDSPVTAPGMVPLETSEQSSGAFSFLTSGRRETEFDHGWRSRLLGSFRPQDQIDDLRFRPIQARQMALRPATLEGRLRKALYWAIGGLMLGALLATLAPPIRRELRWEWTVLLLVCTTVLAGAWMPPEVRDSLILCAILLLFVLSAYFSRFHRLEDGPKRARGVLRFALLTSLCAAVGILIQSLGQPTIQPDGRVTLPPWSKAEA